MKRKDPIYRVDGLRLVLRGSSYFIHGSVAGERIRRGTYTSNLSFAKTALDDLHREFTSGWRSPNLEDDETSWKAVAKAVYCRHRNSAAGRGIPFTITAADVFEAMKDAGFRCAVSGIAYTKRIAPDGPSDPWSPSIDRIENRHGYLRDNIRVVCLAANIAMNRWGFDVLLRLAKAVSNRPATVTHSVLSLSHETAQVIDINRQSVA